MTRIAWYSTETDLSTRERGAVELPAALEIVDRYLDNLKPRYQTGEEALAATTFGFGRRDDDFIEICVHANDRIAVRAELPRGKGLVGKWSGGGANELTLDSAASLKRCVTAYFRMSPEEFREYLATVRSG